MAYTDEDLLKITEAVRSSLVNSGTNTATVTEATDISDVADIVTHNAQGKLTRISPSNFNKENISRLQGTSENSNAMKDPFKFVGSFNTSTIGDLRTWLDNLHGTSSTLDNRGFYRAILNDSVIEITSSPINYTTEEYIQVVRGRVSVASTTGLLTFSYEYNILERKYSATDGWSSWRVVASAGKFEDLYAKAIQIGSFEVESLTDGVGINFSNIDGTQSDSFEIPAATTVSAGVMSAEDKKIVNGIDAAIEEGEKRALRKLFIAAGALYNDTSADITRTAPWGETVIHKVGHYYLNGLGDITEEEMLAIYDAGKYWSSENGAGFGSRAARTNLSPLSYAEYYYKTYNLAQAFNNRAVEVVMLNDVKYMPPSSFADVTVKAINFFGQGAVKLKRVIGVFNFASISNNPIINAPNIEYISIKKLKKSLSTTSALLSKESVLYVIQNAAPTSAITITLHANAYARLAEDADIIAALEAQPLVTLVSA